MSFLSDDLYASIYYNNSSGINGEPSISLDHYRYLNAIWKNGQHVVFGGDGFSAATGADLQIPVNFMFNEDPLQPGSDENAWSEISAGNPPGDRRQVGSIQPFPLAPGETKCVDIALITAFPEVAGDWIQSSLPLLRERNQFIREFYANQNFDCAAEQFPLELEELSLSVDLKLYPNPSRSELFIEGLSEENSQVIVYDLSGRQVMDIQLARSSGSFDISHLDQGIYLAQIVQNDQVLGTRKFIKVN